MQALRAETQLRAGVYGRLSETYDAAESVPTQLDRGTEADLIREAARCLLEEGDTVASILRDWTTRGVKPVAGEVWWPTTLVGTLKSPRLAGLLVAGLQRSSAGCRWPHLLSW